jgi:hypothetical protein
MASHQLGLFVNLCHAIGSERIHIKLSSYIERVRIKFLFRTGIMEPVLKIVLKNILSYFR